MSKARGVDVSYVIYQATDLDRMQTFMEDFGLVTAGRDSGRLYMRGAGPSPYAHVSLQGSENRFIGAGVRVSSREDLDALAALEDSGPVEAIDAPGGGLRVRMTTPDGVRVDAVWGQELTMLPMRGPNPFNAGVAKQRVNAGLRPKREAGLALRMGHFVLRVPRHDETVAWFTERFGMLPSDYLCAGSKDNVVGTFLRVDLGAATVDHHSILITRNREIGVHHCSFEMQDLDAVMSAHDYLSERGYKLECGVGRHLLGSQIYDYWRDPFGFRVEHYTDGDVVNNEYRPSHFVGTADETTQWGMKPPREFFD